VRLFTGIEPSPSVIEKVRPFIRVPEANLHITTKFIGAWPEERLDELKDVLGSIALPPFTVQVAGLTFLAKALCAEVQADPALALQTDGALETLGCARETRVWFPHLTLARPKHENIGELRRMVSQMGKPDFGSFEANEFHLYESRASIYTKLATWRLA
jgi:2'-5' RNA ligase